MRSGAMGVVPILVCLVAPGCFQPSATTGAPCDPMAPTCPIGQACIAGTTGFACLPEGTLPIDGAVDSEVVAPQCPADPALLLCFAFDAPMLASPLANEGVAPVAAALVDVTRIPEGRGGAAQLGLTSTITISTNTSLVGIVAAEVRVRLDAAIPAGGRVGVLDSETNTVPGWSMFLYDTAAGPQLRCNLGGVNLFADVAVPVGTWVVVACACTNGTVAAYLDGVKLAEAVGCEPAYANELGMQIGQNSQAAMALPPDEPVVGALDFVKLWTAVPPHL